MQKITCRLTVLFENPFWVGVYERISDHQMEVCKITFGAEPTGRELYEYLLCNWNRLRFSCPVETDDICEKKKNPKRVRREIARQQQGGIGTKAQQALTQQYLEGRELRRKQSSMDRQLVQKQKFDQKQRKKKQKKKGH